MERDTGRLVRGFVRLGLPRHDAEDCAQETFLRVHQSLDRYVPRAPFGAFLRRVTRSVYVDWCRRQRSRRTALGPSDSGLAVAALPAPRTIDPADRLDLEAAVARLPPRLADVIELGARQGLAYRDVAARLGIPIGTVKSRMYFAVRRLREELRHGR